LNEKNFEQTALRLLDSMYSLVQCFTESETELCKKRKITNAESRIINSINSDSENYVNKIAEVLQLSKSRISRLVSSLKRKGLITKKENDLDHRFNIISLTAKGAEIKQQLFQDKLDRCMDTLSFIPPEIHSDLIAKLGILKKAFDQYKEEASKAKAK
jgi:DNA-binding MarR family transcriptional regulator